MENPLNALDRKPITSVIFDRHPVFARGLARLLEDEAPELEVAGVTSSLSDVQGLIFKILPDVSLVGPDMTSIDDIHMVREICSTFPETKVVLLLERPEPATALRALSSVGIRGFVSKEKEASEIAEVMGLVARGHFVMPADIGHPAHPPPDPRALSDLEREILRGVALRRTNRELAARLHLSQRTVCRRLEEIYAKLGLADRLEAAVYAAMHGIAAGRA